jgi:hypothetical protein
MVLSLQTYTDDDVSSCVGCHWAIFEEWEASRHAVSWANPIFQKNLESAPDQNSCARCHSPTRILAKGPTSIPSPRTEDRDTGVNCITCHADPEGVMHGPFGAISTGHETAQNLLFAADKAEVLCLTCHGQPTVRDHSIRHSYFFPSGSVQEKNCIDCHMPEVTRRQAADPTDILEIPERAGRKHTFLGSHDQETIAGAMSVRIHPDGKVEVTNSGAGHGIPAGSTKTLIIELARVDGAGKVLWKQEAELGQSRQLLPGQTWTAQVPGSADAGNIQVTLWYRYADHQEPEEYLKIGEYR